MKTLAVLLLCSVFLVLQFYHSSGFSFPSIIDDARKAMMKFSTGSYKVPTKKKTTTTSVSYRKKPSSTSRRRRRSSVSSGRRRRRSSPSYSIMVVPSSRRRRIVSSGWFSRRRRRSYKPSSSSRRRRRSSGWSSRRRRRSTTPMRPAPTTPTKYTKKWRAKTSNNFLEVLGKVERSILEAQASGNRKSSLRRLTRNIKLALSKKSYLFARQTLGQALYSALSTRRTGKRSTANHGVRYLKKLKNELGETLFNKLVGFNDDKTLMFAIDDTGSMGGEISAVKHISVALVNSLKGKSGIDYILSVFNDPKVRKPMKFEDGTRMINELNKLYAHGGGDYPELAFTGMQRALEEGPQEGSPMFVFTDATAKDTAKYKEMVIGSAKDFGVNINFLVRGSGPSTFAPFIETAKETCGMMLKLADSREIKKLTSIAKLSLKNYACMYDEENGSGSTGKRSTSKSHVISVDDSLNKIIISVSTARSNPVVTLRNPRGRVQYAGKISLYNAIIYELFNPMAGRWTLTVSASAGKYHYLVRGTGARNIDFDYYFMMVPTRGRKKVPIPISQPLAGQKANTIVTVTGVEKIRASSLKLDLIDSKRGRVLRTLTLTPRRQSKEHFLVSFSPPSTPFRFRLRGTTLSGNNFERSSRKTVKPLTALVRVYKAMNGLLALPRGRRMYVVMKIFNNGPTEVFDVTINDPLGYATSRRKLKVKVYGKRDRRFMMWFRASSSAKPGKGCPIAVTIKGRTSGVKAGHVLNMIVSN